MHNVPTLISIIITTYNNPNALRLILRALAKQDTTNFEVIIADDGSEHATKATILEVEAQVSYSIKHVWHEHASFRAAMIRNKAGALAQGEYLIFLDGDCVPTTTFVRNHKNLAENNYFVVGNRVLLTKNFTEQIFAEHIPIEQWAWWQWLLAGFCGKVNRFLPMLPFGKLYLRYLSRTKWQGAKTCNLGVWREDFLAVNGFDEEYVGWGYEDSDLVVRLIRNGTLRKNGHFAVPVLHLWHPENDRDNEQMNYARLEATLHESYTKAKYGIDQYKRQIS